MGLDRVCHAKQNRALPGMGPMSFGVHQHPFVQIVGDFPREIDRELDHLARPERLEVGFGAAGKKLARGMCH